MAGRKAEYKSQAITTSIKFTSRESVKIGDNFFTVECCEERIIPDLPGIKLDKEKEMLWDAVNTEVDKQIDDIWEQWKKEQQQRKHFKK